MVLLVSATTFEIEPAIAAVRERGLQDDVKILVTGVGPAATMYHLLESIHEQVPSLVIHAGIAGAFNRRLRVGSVVTVASDEWADLGIEDHGTFSSVFDMGFTQPDERPYTSGSIILNAAPLSLLWHLPKVTAVTSSMAHGAAASIERITSKYNPDIETMEGAAAAYVCVMKDVPIVQLRAISNYVQPRDKTTWDIPLAVANLNKQLVEFIDKVHAS